MVAKSGWISAALLPGLRSFEVFAVFVVQKRVTITVVMNKSSFSSPYQEKLLLGVRVSWW